MSDFENNTDIFAPYTSSAQTLSANCVSGQIQFSLCFFCFFVSSWNKKWHLAAKCCTIKYKFIRFQLLCPERQSADSRNLLAHRDNWPLSHCRFASCCVIRKVLIMTTLSKCKAVELFYSLYFSLATLSELNSLQNCGSTEQRAVSLPIWITSKQRLMLMHICSANLARINKHIFKLKSAASRGDPAAWVLLDQAGKRVLEALGQLISLDGDKSWHQVW